MRILKRKNVDKIVFVENGNFYIAIGKDAILLHKLFNLKCTCFIKYICKVGIPIRSIDKYLKALEEKEYSYIVYNNVNGEFKVYKKNLEEMENDEVEYNLSCEECNNAIYVYEKEEINKLIKDAE